MLTKATPAYLYRQYADDEDVRAFFTAQNQAAQMYVDWTNANPLFYYPGLSGSLLEWALTNLYGVPKPQLASIGVPAEGMLNTLALNTYPLNTYIAGAAGAAYSLSDDIYKRIATWNLYKGDGKRFCIRWMKRRVMRFLIGVNGLEPRPQDPGFIIGVENTTPISIGVAAGVMTITVHRAALAALITVTPECLSLLPLIFQSGALDLPAQYSYIVTLA